MDHKNSSEDILNEIMNRASNPTPASSSPPRFVPASWEEEPSPPPPPDVPEEPVAGTGGKLLPYLCLVLGAALLVLGVCVLQVVGMNRRLEGLEEAVEHIALIDQLQRDNKILQQEKEELKQEAEQFDAQRWELENEKLDALQRYYGASFQNQRLQYLWYLQQFMDSGDYPMAAIALVDSMESLFANTPLSNPAQEAQYLAYRQELLDRGYLQPSDLDSSPYAIMLAPEWTPDLKEKPDLAALGILWEALEQAYIYGLSDLSAACLMSYQDYPPDNAADGTVQLYQQLLQDLIGQGFLVEQNGTVEPSEALKEYPTYRIYFSPYPPFLYGDENGVIEYGATDILLY